MKTFSQDNSGRHQAMIPSEKIQRELALKQFKLAQTIRGQEYWANKLRDLHNV